MADHIEGIKSYDWEELLSIFHSYEVNFGAGLTHMFIVSAEIHDAAVEIGMIETGRVSTWGEVLVPLDAKRHGHTTLLAIELSDGKYGLVHLWGTDPDPIGGPHTIVAFQSSINGTENGIGAYVPGEHMLISQKFSKDSDLANAFIIMIFKCSLIMSLINQPNITSVSPALSRQQRRAMARSGRLSSSGPSIVRWNIGEGAKARALAASGGRPRALHWRRGHWRRAEQHYHGAVQRSEGGWWQWIEGMWVGHPAFGVIKSIHAPQIAS